MLTAGAETGIATMISSTMSIGHEKLDVFRMAIEYVAWVVTVSLRLKGDNRHAQDQWLRASQSIPLNIAEGNGKTTSADRRRFFEIARGSALECAAIQDVVEVLGILEAGENRQHKKELDRIAAMRRRLGGRGYRSQ